MNGTSPFVGAMKIARNLPASERHDEWHAPIPGSLSEGAVERSETEGVYFGEWYSVPISEFRRGDENRPQTFRFPGGTMNGTHPFPAPSLRELAARKG